MLGRETLSEALLLDALREEAVRRPLAGVLLIGVQTCSTVRATNQLVGSEQAELLHLDRAAGAVACGLGNRERFLGDEPAPGDRPAGAESYAVVALNVEAAKSYRLLRDLVGQTARYVDASGAVLVAGPRKGGAEVAARALHDVFESVVLVAYRKGHRIYRASGPRAPEPAVQDLEMVVLRGRELRLLLDDRIFARGRLDPATRMLAEAFEVPPGAAVLDLGAGNGLLGILAALLEPSCHAWLVDSDPLAAQTSRNNAALNGASNVSVHMSDVLRDLPGQTFDVVLTNPPFHRGRVWDTSIAERFVVEARQALRPGGSVYVVCNRFLRYEPTLERLVGPVREVAGDRRFKVLLARLPGAPRA
jgi:16S rRNA (guanine1207-N2)-methyltransferase